MDKMTQPELKSYYLNANIGKNLCYKIEQAVKEKKLKKVLQVLNHSGKNYANFGYNNNNGTFFTYIEENLVELQLDKSKLDNQIREIKNLTGINLENL